MEQATNNSGQHRALTQTPPPPPSPSPSQHADAAHTFVTTLSVTNIHCPSCVSYAQSVLRPIAEVAKVDVSIAKHSIRVEHFGDSGSKVTEALTDAAFKVQHVRTTDSSGVLVHESHPQPPAPRIWARKHLNSKV